MMVRPKELHPRRNRPAVRVLRREQPPGVEIPELHRLILGTRGQDALAREIGASALLRVRALHDLQRVPVHEIPERQRPVLADGYHLHGVGVALVDDARVDAADVLRLLVNPALAN